VPDRRAGTYLSVNTVRTHVRHIYDKLGAHNRSNAVRRARELGAVMVRFSRGSRSASRRFLDPARASGPYWVRAIS